VLLIHFVKNVLKIIIMYKQHLFNQKTQVYIKSNCAFTCVLHVLAWT